MLHPGFPKGHLSSINTKPDRITNKNQQTASIRNLRNNPTFLFVRLPYILSFLCIVAGVIWLFLLPLNDYSRRTYISENALLPGQVHAYFSGSEQHIFRGYKKELEGLLGRNVGNNGGDEVQGQGEEQEQKNEERTPVYVWKESPNPFAGATMKRFC